MDVSPLVKQFATVFSTVFLAELGDKTQLATMALSTQGNKWVVFAGSALALVATSALGVLAGSVVSKYIAPIWINRAAGVLFLVLGAAMLLRGE